LIVCVPVPYADPPSIGTNKVCADYNWNATITRAGDPSLTRVGEALRVELPVDVHGQAGLNGDLARVLSLSGRTSRRTRGQVSISGSISTNSGAR
jgi:hypothetical protein